jgi:hypothetical protein
VEYFIREYYSDGRIVSRRTIDIPSLPQATKLATLCMEVKRLFLLKVEVLTHSDDEVVFTVFNNGKG